MNESSHSGRFSRPKCKETSQNLLRSYRWGSVLKSTFTLGVFLSIACIARGQHSLRIELTPQFAGKPLVFDALTNVTKAGQPISVTRLDLLLTDFALRHENDSWIENTNWSAYISARNGRTTCEVNDVSEGTYNAIRFTVGVPANLNHADPAQFPPLHALNPSVNGMHWNWRGGYVFFAMEGHWLAPSRLSGVQGSDVATSYIDPDPEPGRASLPITHLSAESGGGFSYHVATDTQLMTVTLPVSVVLRSNVLMRLALDVERVFAGGNSIEISRVNSSSHSRDGDDVADLLHQNVERSFAVRSVESAAPSSIGVPRQRLEIAASATPYRFTMSASFPQPNLPADNPLTREGVALGQRLFNEPLLSLNGAQSCASCHDARKAFAENRRVSTGAEGKPGTRNAMPLFNLAWKKEFFWDGRARSLREQVLQPIQNPIEMHESLTNVVAKLHASGYGEMFAQAFGSTSITADRVARALEQFLLTQVSHDSKFDQVSRGEAEFTEEEERGFQLFHTEYDPRRGQFGADCFHCHGGPLFQSVDFANNGLDFLFKDSGRSEFTKRRGDEGKFSVPSLRNVEVTAPYMHDGRFSSLEETIEHYSASVKRSATLDPNLAKHPDGGVPLTTAQKRALIAFLKTLTDEKFKTTQPVIVQR